MALQRLILLRHAKAEHRAASGEDIDRELTESGRADARAMGERLFREELTPDIALVSTAARAEQTWTEAAHAFPPRTRAEYMRQLYNAPADVLLEAARDIGAASVMVVAHNPGIQTLATELMALAEGDAGLARLARTGFSPATAAVFRIEGPLVACEGLFSPADEGR
jgi:phosphohistidine phosphatase